MKNKEIKIIGEQLANNTPKSSPKTEQIRTIDKSRLKEKIGHIDTRTINTVV